MLRRPSKLDTPLTQKQADLVRKESQLREEMEKLERMIKDAPRAAEETSRREREELLRRASEGGNRLDVSLTIQDKRFSDNGGGSGRRVSMRKERREGRLIFLVLVIALAVAVIWLVTNFHF
jgi:hypothetical protein